MIGGWQIIFQHAVSEEMILCGIFSIVLVDSKTFLVHLGTKVISG